MKRKGDSHPELHALKKLPQEVLWLNFTLTQQYSMTWKSGPSAITQISMPAFLAAAPRQAPMAERTLASGSMRRRRVSCPQLSEKLLSFVCSSATCSTLAVS